MRLFRFSRFAAPVVSILLLAGCVATRGGPVPYSKGDFAMPDPVELPQVEAEHHVVPGDVLNVDVFQVASVSGDREVDSLGRVQMPLIGTVPVMGKTTAEIASDLTQRLNTAYLKQPRVQVTIKSTSQQTFTVDGSVRQPGLFPITGPMSLIQAIALARGADDNANVKRVVIFRRIEGKRQAAAFDLSSIRKAQEPDPAIYGGDVIVVDGSKTRQAFRDFLSSVPLLAVFRPF